MFLWIEYLTLCQGRRIRGLAGQKWYRVQSNLYYQTPKESKSSNFLKGPLFRLTWRLLWWPAFNIPSNTSFSDGPVCLLSLARCGELNMPLIFICAVQTASTYIPLREITKINAGWHILNEETNRNIYFSVHIPQCLLRVRTNWQQQYRIPSGYRLSQWRPVMQGFFSFIIWEKSMQKYNKRKNDLHLKSSFFITVLGLDVAKVALFGVVISHTIEYQVF